MPAHYLPSSLKLHASELFLPEESFLAFTSSFPPSSPSLQGLHMSALTLLSVGVMADGTVSIAGFGIRHLGSNPTPATCHPRSLGLII